MAGIYVDDCVTKWWNCLRKPLDSLKATKLKRFEKKSTSGKKYVFYLRLLVRTSSFKTIPIKDLGQNSDVHKPNSYDLHNFQMFVQYVR